MPVRSAFTHDRLLTGYLEHTAAVPFDIHFAFRAMRVFREAVPAVTDLPAIAEQLDAVGVGVLHRMMVVDLAVVLVFAHLSAAEGLGVDRMIVDHPIADVEIMHVLFDDVVAGEPIEVVPVIDLILHFCLLGGAGPDPNASGVEVGPHEHEVADRAIVDLLNHLRVFSLMAQMVADADGQPFLLGYFIDRQNSSYAR